MKLYETIARYLLGIIYLFGAFEGAMFLFFDTYLHGKPQGVFLPALQETTYFWAFMKFIELAGAISLLANYKPALGLVLLTPITAVLALFYVFELQWFIAFTIIVSLTIVLLRAYWPSYIGILKSYPH